MRHGEQRLSTHKGEIQGAEQWGGGSSLWLYWKHQPEDNYAKLLSGSMTKYIVNNVRDWCLPMGCVSSWAGCSLAIPSFSAPSFSCISSRQDTFWVGTLSVLLVSLPLHRGSCLAAGCGLFRVHISLLCNSAKIRAIDSFVALHFVVCGTS